MLEMNTEHVTHILFRVVQQDGALVGDGAGKALAGARVLLQGSLAGTHSQLATDCHLF